MNSFDLNIDHRCSNWLPAHFIFILTGFSPWVNVYDMMITSCLDLSKTQSILFSLLWCPFEMGVYSSDLTIEAESCCIFSDFFLEDMLNKIIDVVSFVDPHCHPSLDWMIVLMHLNWSFFLTPPWPSYMSFFHTMTWWPQYMFEYDEIIQHSHSQLVPHSVCCHCWYRSL